MLSTEQRTFVLVLKPLQFTVLEHPGMGAQANEKSDIKNTMGFNGNF